ncbi:MAG TPA: hypothetical protein VH186_26930 [Chloroflexia bacterium]|nr:hypothetical protein [Chloroflexia bacterium]
MQVKILEVAGAPGSDRRVRFESEVGQAWANWMGDEPTLGEVYDVELTVNDSLYWDEDIEAVPDERALIEASDDSVIIQATLESCEEDGFTVLKVGTGNLTLTAYGDPPLPGSTVRATAKTLILSDNRY